MHVFHTLFLRERQPDSRPITLQLYHTLLSFLGILNPDGGGNLFLRNVGPTYQTTERCNNLNDHNISLQIRRNIRS